MPSGENFSQLYMYIQQSQIPSLPLCLSGIVAYGVSFIGLHLTDCSTCDHGNHWILDAVIDLAKKSWGGIFEVWESSPSKGAWIKPCAEDLTAVIYTVTLSHIAGLERIAPVTSSLTSSLPTSLCCTSDGT